MSGVLGSIVNGVMVHGLRVIETLFPGPDRLGTPIRTVRPLSDTADPVILVGGYANRPEGWIEWQRSLQADGFSVSAFFNPTSGLGDIYESAARLAAYIDAVAKRSPTGKVDLVGFSEGGLLARMAVSMYGCMDAVDSVISLATPHNGIDVQKPFSIFRKIPILGSLLPPATDQLIKGSQLINALAASDAAIRKHGPVTYTSIYAADVDGLIFPDAARLAGANNVPLSDRKHFFFLRGPSHYGIYHSSHSAYDAARGALLVTHGERNRTAIAASLLKRKRRKRVRYAQAVHTQASSGVPHRRPKSAR